jgi:Ca2+-transporting ATPase
MTTASSTDIDSLNRSAAFHALDVEQSLTAVASSRDGLSSSEARSRLQRYGPNVIPRGKRDGPLVLFWRQIHNPLIWVLIASGGVAMLVDWEGEGIKNGVVILAVVLINSIIGFVQEFRAGKAIEALSEMVPQNVSVLRDGRQATLPAANLVPGDVVLLTPGDHVPADLRLMTCKNVQIDEAMLTGESVPATKGLDPVAEEAPLGDRASLAFAGTLVTYGTGSAVVVATGSSTELGKISDLLRDAPELETPLIELCAKSASTSLSEFCSSRPSCWRSARRARCWKRERTSSKRCARR